MALSKRIDQYLAENTPATPCVIIDLESVRRRCIAIQSMLPDADVYLVAGLFQPGWRCCIRHGLPRRLPRDRWFSTNAQRRNAAHRGEDLQKYRLRTGVLMPVDDGRFRRDHGPRD